MYKKIFYIIRAIIGVILILIGVVSGFIPIVQGWLFIFAGLLLIGVKRKTIKKWFTKFKNWLKKRVQLSSK